MENIEEKLMQDELFREHFVKKHPPKYEFLETINPSVLGRDSHLDYVINWLKDYIEFPLLEDNFVLVPNEYSSREEWREKLIKKYGEEAKKFLFENKLRINTSMSGLSSAVCLIDFCLGEEFPALKNKTKDTINITKEDISDYNKRDTNGRIEFVRKIEDKAYGVLQELSNN
jgi:hypothetical protein